MASGSFETRVSGTGIPSARAHCSCRSLLAEMAASYRFTAKVRSENVCINPCTNLVSSFLATWRSLGRTSGFLMIGGSTRRFHRTSTSLRSTGDSAPSRIATRRSADPMRKLAVAASGRS